ncbi:MAG: SMP-30/gluconolactonase/LRE family protein [Caulobacterales bacterium]
MALLAGLMALAACAPDGASGSPPAALPVPIQIERQAWSYPEGPLWIGSRVAVAEMGADRVTVLDVRQPDQAPVVWQFRFCGPTALAPYGDGFVVLCHLAGQLAVVDRNGIEVRRIGGEAGVSLRNPNDGASDLQGGVYFSDPGDFYRPRQPVGRVVWLDPQGRLHEVARGLSYPNGVYVVAEGGQRFAYVSEHFARRVLRYPILNDGTFGPMQVWATIPEQGSDARFSYDQAGPDGLERATDGSWYVAIYGEGRVLRLTDAGTLVGQLNTPFQYVTNMAVGPNGEIVVVGPYIHDAAPFRGGVIVASPADFAAHQP